MSNFNLLDRNFLDQSHFGHAVRQNLTKFTRTTIVLRIYTHFILVYNDTDKQTSTITADVSRNVSNVHACLEEAHIQQYIQQALNDTQ